jgi:acyl-CoA synthetase (AMP-forming)/AMP-acid ligase II
VSPPEVEKAIGKVTGGLSSYVLGIHDAQRGQLVAAVIAVPDGSTTFDETALRERLKSELSVYKIPNRFIALPSADIPLLSSGKVDTEQLRKLFDV